MESPPNKWAALWREMNRRHVVQVTVAYVVLALAFLQGADVILPALVEDSETPMRALVVLSIVGLPAVLVLAWVYDLTPWGVQRTSALPLPEEARVVRLPEQVEGEPGRGDPRSIAVLPFMDRSAEQNQEYFADGVAEELINQLARRTVLHVVARTSSFAYRTEERDIRDIGRELGVDVVLEGSVRKAHSRLRITAQLVSVADGYQVWAHQFDRDEGDVFAIQDEIAAAVIESLRVGLRPGVPERSEGPGTQNAEAYDLYLKGRHLWTRRYRLGLQHALQYFERSAALDPDFSLPVAGMADVYTALGIYSFLPGDQAEAKAMVAAGRALEIGEGQPSSHIAYGRAVAFFRWAWSEAEEHHMLAAALDPADGEIMASAAQLSVFRGRVSEAIERAEHALVLAPNSSFAGAMVGAVFLYAGRVERAIAHLTSVRERDPEHTPVLYLLGVGLSDTGHPDRAIPVLEEAVTLTHRALPFMAVLGSSYAAAGRAADAQALLDELRARRSSEYISPVGTAMISATLGDLDGAFTDFEAGLTESRATATQTIREPSWRPLWGDPRWRVILDRMDLAPMV